MAQFSGPAASGGDAPQRRRGRRGRALAGAVLAAALSPATTLNAEEFPGLEALMSDEDFARSGLDTLAPRQLEALDQWLGGYLAGRASMGAAAAAGNTAGGSGAAAENEDDVIEELNSRLVGDFNGWDGRTLFRLENGQVWQQRLGGRYRYSGPPNPPVRIKRNWLGWYTLTLVDEGRSIGVNRVR